MDSRSYGALPFSSIAGEVPVLSAEVSLKMNRRSFRYFSAMAVLGLGVIIILFRYGSLAAQKNRVGPSEISEAERGDIVDRNGRILAMDAALYNIAVWKPETNPEGFRADALKLGDILQTSGADLVARYQEGSSDFFYIKKRVQPPGGPDHSGRQGPPGASPASSSSVLRAGSTPEKRLASHVLGFVGDGNRGLAGVENRYDMELSTVRRAQGGERERGREAGQGKVPRPHHRRLDSVFSRGDSPEGQG